MSQNTHVYDGTLYTVAFKMPTHPIVILYSGNDRTVASAIYGAARSLMLSLAIPQDWLCYTESPTHIEWTQQAAD